VAGRVRHIVGDGIRPAVRIWSAGGVGRDARASRETGRLGMNGDE
jgi:hypothetical protein